MTGAKHQEHVTEIQDTLTEIEDESDTELEIDEQEIANRLRDYTDNRIDPSTAVDHVVDDILEGTSLDNPNKYTSNSRGSAGGSYDNEKLTADQIQEENRWIEFTGTVIELYDTSSDDSKFQQGRLADDTGTVRFTVWSSSDINTHLELGETYNLEPVVTNEYRQQFEITLTDATQVEHLEDDTDLDINPETYTETTTGAVVDFQSQMGLIDRCPNEECSGRVLRKNNYCPDCGEVESELDMRTKAVLDNGDTTWTIFLGQEKTESLTGLTFEKAKDLAEEYSDRVVVREYLEGELHGEYLRLDGINRGRRFDVDACELIDPPTINDLEKTKTALEKAIPDETNSQ